MTQAPATSVASSRERVPVFGTEENRATLMATYDEALRHWPVPFETSFVTRHGKTYWLNRERRRGREAGAEHPELRDRDPAQAGHIMSVDEPEFAGERIVNFLEAEKGRR